MLKRPRPGRYRSPAGLAERIPAVAVWSLRRLNKSQAEADVPYSYMAATQTGSGCGPLDALHSPSTSWILAALRGEIPRRLGDSDNVSASRVLGAADAHGVRQLLCISLRDSPVWAQLPSGLRDALNLSYRRAIAQELFLRDAVAAELDVLGSAGIEVLLLKGTALAYGLYPYPEARPRCDVDLLFRDRQAAEAAWDLLQERGYKRGTTITGDLVSHQFSCDRQIKPNIGLVLDIHWRISNTNFFADKFDFAELWEDRRAVAELGANAYALDLVNGLLHALLHRITHRSYIGHERLIWIKDFDLFCRALEPTEWTHFAERVQKLDLGPICRDGLLHAQGLFSTPLPNGLLQRFEPRNKRSNRQLLLRDPSRIRRTLLELQFLRSWPRRVRYLWEHLFPSRDYMKARFGVDDGFGLVNAYVRRIAGAITKEMSRSRRDPPQSP